VADALSRKSLIKLATMSISQPQLMKLEVVTRGLLVLLSELLERIKDAEGNDPECQRIWKQLEEGKTKEFVSL
jgi:hypothetical protein